jgi:hypothetical protein
MSQYGNFARALDSIRKRKSTNADSMFAAFMRKANSPDDGGFRTAPG